MTTHRFRLWSLKLHVQRQRWEEGLQAASMAGCVQRIHKQRQPAVSNFSAAENDLQAQVFQTEPFFLVNRSQIRPRITACPRSTLLQIFRSWAAILPNPDWPQYCARSGRLGLGLNSEKIVKSSDMIQIMILGTMSTNAYIIRIKCRQGGNHRVGTSHYILQPLPLSSMHFRSALFSLTHTH